MSLLDLLRSDGSIVVNKKLAHAIGIDAAIMYSELISKQFYFELRWRIMFKSFIFGLLKIYSPTNREAENKIAFKIGRRLGVK